MATKTETPEETKESKVTIARNKNLDLAIQQIAKDFGDGAIMRLGESTKMDVESIPTGNILIDRALGCGGSEAERLAEGGRQKLGDLARLILQRPESAFAGKEFHRSE